MTRLNLPLLFAGVMVPISLIGASAPLTQATFTRIINDVKVARQADQAIAPAKVNERFAAPDIVRTAVDSLAELTAADNTITRVGANTVFSFSDSGRTVNLQQGSLLFHSPKGRGGGTVKTGGAAAAVLGTTMIVSATVDGGFKVVVLEGRAQVTLPNGNFRQLEAGQLLFVLPGGNQFGPRITINLGTLVRGSRLVTGFPEPLPSQPEVNDAVARQEKLIASGGAEDTGKLVGNRATTSQVETVDSNTVEQGAGNRLTAAERALQRNVLIQSANLNLHPDQLFLSSTILNARPLGTEDYAGLFGMNIHIDHPSIQLLPAAHDTFDFLAAGTLLLDNVTGPSVGQIFFQGPSVASPFDLVLVGNPLNLGSTSFLTYSPFSSGDMFMVSGGNLSVGNLGLINIQNSFGGLALGAFGSLNVNDAFLNAQALGLSASTSLVVTDQTVLSTTGPIRTFSNLAAIGTGPGLLSIGASQFSSQGFTASESVLFAPYDSNLKGATDLLFNLVDFTFATVQVRLDAQTVTLDQVAFPAGVDAIFRTTMGQANINNGVMTGYANLISVSVGGAPVNVGSLGTLVADINNPNVTAPLQVQVLP